MKKILLLLLAGISLSSAASAQSPITLKWKDYGGFPASDTVAIVDDLLPLSNIRNPLVNGVWDLSGLSYGSQRVINRDSIQIVNSGGAQGYVYRQPQEMALGNLNYSGKVQFMRDTFSLGVISRETGPFTIGLDSITGVATDKLYVPQQTIGLDSQEYVLKFPATMDSTWTSHSRYSIGYELTLAAGQYNNKSFSRNLFKIVKGTVIGWGKAVIGEPLSGRPSDSIEVLQVEVIDTTYSSYSGGIDPVALNALNLQDGSSHITSYIWLVRKGETTPLFSVRYNGIPSSTPESAEVHINRITYPVPSSVTIVASTDAVKIYPNPVRRGERLSVACETSGLWQMRLSSLTGQQVFSAKWNAAQAGVETLNIPQHLAEGLYIFQLSKDGQPVKTGRLLLAE